MSVVVKIVGEGMVVLGGGFLFLGSFGIWRFPDVYNRLQAGTKCTTLGAFLTLVGIGFIQPLWLPKVLLTAFFILLTNPVASHALGRASCKAGVKLWPKSVVDKTREFSECRKEKEG